MENNYSSAGIDLTQMESMKDTFKAFANLTNTPNVLGSKGSFAGLYKLTGFDSPVLVASTDGVGTKLKISAIMGHYESLGKDLVVLNANDIVCKGATPLFFLNYIAFSEFNSHMLESLMKGMVWACKSLDCSMLSGETANMPGVYTSTEFDLAGFIVGCAEENQIITGDSIEPGDTILGIPSNGLHTNGFSLVRRVFSIDNNPTGLFKNYPELNHSLGEELLKPHRSYYHELKTSYPLIKGLAHITGGGLPGKLQSIMPTGTQAIIDTTSWDVPKIFQMIQRIGSVSSKEMFNVFNMGIGMVVVTDKESVTQIKENIPSLIEIGYVSDTIAPNADTVQLI